MSRFLLLSVASAKARGRSLDRLSCRLCSIGSREPCRKSRSNPQRAGPQLSRGTETTEDDQSGLNRQRHKLLPNIRGCLSYSPFTPPLSLHCPRTMLLSPFLIDLWHEYRNGSLLHQVQW